MSRPGHYSPEEIYERVKQALTSIWLATVYKNLKTFVQVGMLHELALITLRGASGERDPHHLVCKRCQSISDLPVDSLAPARFAGYLWSMRWRLNPSSLNCHGAGHGSVR